VYGSASLSPFPDGTISFFTFPDHLGFWSWEPLPTAIYNVTLWYTYVEISLSFFLIPHEDCFSCIILPTNPLSATFYPNISVEQDTLHSLRLLQHKKIFLRFLDMFFSHDLLTPMTPCSPSNCPPSHFQMPESARQIPMSSLGFSLYPTQPTGNQHSKMVCFFSRPPPFETLMNDFSHSPFQKFFIVFPSPNTQKFYVPFLRDLFRPASSKLAPSY